MAKRLYITYLIFGIMAVAIVADNGESFGAGIVYLFAMIGALALVRDFISYQLNHK